MVSSRFTRLLPAAALASPFAATAAPRYTVTHLPFTSIEKVKLNNAGQVSGTFYSDNGELRAGIWRNGTLTALPISEADWPYGIVGAGMRPHAINAAGRIAGPGFLYSHGAVTPLDGMGYVWGINNTDTIVGTVGGELRAAMMKHGEVSLLDPSDPNQSVVYDVNDAGQIVAWACRDNPYYCGFVLLTPVSKSSQSSPDQDSVNPADRL